MKNAANDIKFAAKYNKFLIYYQPVIELKSNRIIGAEALIRWEHPARGFISPEEFIPIAENLNLISSIGKFVLDRACRFMANLNKELEQSLSISINFSNQQFIHENCVDDYLEIIKESQIDIKKVVIEITESLMMSHQNRYIRQLKKFRKSGIKVALDDFGTGYSSLSYLKKLPLDIIKIDKAFIIDLLVDESDASLVETILNIAGNFGLEVVAEGVEQAEHVDFLIKRDCLYAQGYYFSKPVPEEQFANMAKTHLQQ